MPAQMAVNQQAESKPPLNKSPARGRAFILCYRNRSIAGEDGGRTSPAEPVIHAGPDDVILLAVVEGKAG
jgi:hypothetical protein